MAFNKPQGLCAESDILPFFSFSYAYGLPATTPLRQGMVQPGGWLV